MPVGTPDLDQNRYATAGAFVGTRSRQRVGLVSQQPPALRCAEPPRSFHLVGIGTRLALLAARTPHDWVGRHVLVSLLVGFDRELGGAGYFVANRDEAELSAPPVCQKLYLPSVPSVRNTASSKRSSKTSTSFTKLVMLIRDDATASTICRSVGGYSEPNKRCRFTSGMRLSSFAGAALDSTDLDRGSLGDAGFVWQQ